MVRPPHRCSRALFYGFSSLQKPPCRGPAFPASLNPHRLDWIVTKPLPPRPLSGTLLKIIFLRCWPVSVGASSSLSPGVSVEPGLTAFTRMRRSFKSVVHVRANERTAALLALYTLFDANPLLATMDAFRITEAPSGSSGS